MVFLLGFLTVAIGLVAGRSYIRRQSVEALANRIKGLREEVDLLINKHNDILLLLEANCTEASSGSEVPMNA